MPGRKPVNRDDKFRKFTCLGCGFYAKNWGTIRQYTQYVVAQCECGTIDIYNVNWIRAGNTTSCGCAKRKNLIAKLKKTITHDIVTLYLDDKKILIDVDDYERIKDYCVWHIPPKTGPMISKNNNRYKLSRFVVDCPKHMIVDHKDLNPWNNCKSNLRIVTNGQNQLNQKKRKCGKSRYKGIKCYKNKKGEVWQAVIGYKGKKFYLGSFATEEEASYAYDNAARKYYGNIARVNHPTNGELSAL